AHASHATTPTTGSAITMRTHATRAADFARCVRTMSLTDHTVSASTATLPSNTVRCMSDCIIPPFGDSALRFAIHESHTVTRRPQGRLRALRPQDSNLYRKAPKACMLPLHQSGRWWTCEEVCQDSRHT